MPYIYVMAMVVASMIVGGVMFYIQQTKRTFEQLVGQTLLKQQRDGTVPPELQDVDIEAADVSKLHGFAITVPKALMRRIRIAMALTDWWYIWGPMVLIVCYGSAAWFEMPMKREK
jgi:hypothetical protein